MSDDLIRRSDAIKAVEECLKLLARPRYTVKTAIEAIPSVDVDISEYSDKLWRNAYERGKAERPQEWIPCSERLPSEEERKEWIDNNLDGIGYLYPCLVTRYSSINPDRTKNNPYVAKHYFDGEDFVNCGEEVCSEYILAWMPLPEPWKGADDERIKTMSL